MVRFGSDSFRLKGGDVMGGSVRPAGSEPSRHLWWALSPAYTVGVIAFIPVVHAAIALRRRELWYYAAGLLVGDIAVWSLVSGSSETNGSTTVGSGVGTVIAVLLAVVGTALGLRLRAEVFPGSHPPVSTSPSEEAVARAKDARRRRVEAADLAIRDPNLARDLMIGRPDLPRQYDDGGLVDINHVPESVLVSSLHFSAAQARAVVEVRNGVGRFESANDMSNLADLPPSTVDAVRDRIVTL